VYVVARGPTFEEIKLLVVPFEGNISHMYVDTEGVCDAGGRQWPLAILAAATGSPDRM
jgi:hypothetical protein